jgi:hypothetical protein
MRHQALLPLNSRRFRSTARSLRHRARLYRPGLACSNTAEKELELLFIGEQFCKAIGSFYENTTGGVKQYPSHFKVLEDKRFPQARHYFRKIYRDPITGMTA